MDRGVKRGLIDEHPSASWPQDLHRATTNKRPKTCSFDWPDNPFDRLPDELVVAVLVATADADAVVQWALTCARHYRLAMDPVVWRGLCHARFGPHLLHMRFQDAGKDWRWLYRAQASVVYADSGPAIGACIIDVIARPPETAKKDWVYWGDLVDGLPDGYGVCLRLPSVHCADAPHPTRSAVYSLPMADARGVARSYEGQWKAGRYHGHGVHIDGLGTRYEGGWKEGQRHGYAVARYDDGGVHEGHWQNNARHGRGASRYANGSTYEGEWRSNKYHGRGVRTEPCGTTYDGQFEDGFPCGQGTQRCADGAAYEGEWNGGRHHGRGVCRYATDRRTRANGETARATVAASTPLSRAMPTTAAGWTDANRAEEHTATPRGPSTRATGTTGASTATVSAATPPAASTRGNGKRAPAAGRARSSTRRAVGTKASSVTADDVARAPTAGPTARGTQAHGSTSGSAVSACASLPTAGKFAAPGGTATAPAGPNHRANKR